MVCDRTSLTHPTISAIALDKPYLHNTMQALSEIALITLIVVDRLQEDVDRFGPIVVEISE